MSAPCADSECRDKLPSAQNTFLYSNCGRPLGMNVAAETRGAIDGANSQEEYTGVGDRRG